MRFSRFVITRIEVRAGVVIPRGWGIAYTKMYTAVILPMPINIVVGLVHALLARIKQGPLTPDKRLEIYGEGVRHGLSEARELCEPERTRIFAAGRAEGFAAGRNALLAHFLALNDKPRVQ